MRHCGKMWMWLSALGVIIALAGCGLGGGSSTSTASAGTTPTPTVAPGVTFGAQPCPSGVTPAFYSTLLKLTADEHVETLKCADFRHDGTLEVLLGVRLDGTGSFLNVYLYSLPNGNTATQLYYDLGLGGGTVAISRVSTILLNSVDAGDCVNAGASSNASLQPSWSQEIGWNGTGFMPLIFPGIYPYLTRFDAEHAQQQVDGGAMTPPAPTDIVNQFFTQQLHYPAADPGTTLTTSDDTTAQVQSYGFTFVLRRMVTIGSKGVWDIVSINAQPNLAALTTPANLAQVSSPIAVSGNGAASNSGSQFVITVRDHANCAIGHTSIPAPATSGPLTASVSYTADSGVTVQNAQGTLGGTAYQEGTLWVTQQKADGTYANLQIVKLLLS
jgi:hypothetical protein